MFVLSPSVEQTTTSACWMPGGVERLDLQRGADREAPAGVLPGLVEVVVEQGVGLLGLVEDAHLVTLLDHPLGDRGADAAAADYQDEHGSTCTRRIGAGRRQTPGTANSSACAERSHGASAELARRASVVAGSVAGRAAAPSGGAVTSTRQGAFSST